MGQASTFYKWAKDRDRRALDNALKSDPKLLCRALVKIFGPCPEQGVKAKPGACLKVFCSESQHLDLAITRQLVGRGFVRPRGKSGLESYYDQVYLLTRKGRIEILNHSADVISDDVLNTFHSRNNALVPNH